MSLVLALNYELIHEQQGNHYQFLTYDILHKVLTCLFYLFIEDMFLLHKSLSNRNRFYNIRKNVAIWSFLSNRKMIR